MITKDGTIGKIAFIKQLPKPATLNSGVFVIRLKVNNIYAQYLYYIFKSEYFINFLNRLTAGSTIIHLYQKDFKDFSIPLPNSMKEQLSIASILSKMDSELDTLEKKLDKYKQVKQGMMQNLLTGKIRLV